MLLTQLKVAAAVLLTLGLAGTGVGLFAQRGAARQPAPKPAPAAEKKTEVRDAPAPAEAPAPPAKPAAKEESRPLQDKKLADMLKTRVQFQGIDDPNATLAEVLDQLSKRFDIAFEVNQKAFASAAEGGEAPEDVLQTRVAQDGRPLTATDARLSTVLQKVLSRVPSLTGVRFLVRKEHIEITTAQAVREEFGIPRGRPLLPLVWESFDNVPLATALQTLGDDSNFNIVIDPHLAGKLKTPVTATLKNVPVDTAVRLLAGMDGLRAVRADNVFYITPAENADWVEEKVAGRKPQE